MKPLQTLKEEPLSVPGFSGLFGTRLIAGDFNRDGRAELVTGVASYPRWGKALVFQGQGQGLAPWLALTH